MHKYILFQFPREKSYLCDGSSCIQKGLSMRWSPAPWHEIIYCDWVKNYPLDYIALGMYQHRRVWPSMRWKLPSLVVTIVNSVILKKPTTFFFGNGYISSSHLHIILCLLSKQNHLYNY